MSTSESEPGATEVVAAQPSDPLVGRRFKERYEILEPLGRGGMATVHLAHDRDAGQRVVVKMPRPDLVREIGRDMHLLGRFLREVDAQAELEHNHVVRIRDRGHVDVLGIQLPFVVADYKDGGDLEKKLREGKQDLDEVLEWLIPIARALDFSHERGWVHRDVKPDNILYDRQGFVYLSDFGIAKAITTGSETTPVQGDDAVPATSFGHVIGTPGYIPPEAVGREYLPAYDQFSLAVVVAQALSGEKPSADGATSRVDEIVDGLPRGAIRVLRRALAQNPRQRFPSCVAFAEALRDEAAKAQTARRRWLAAGAAGVAVVAAAAFWALRDEPTLPPATDATQAAATAVPEEGLPEEALPEEPAVPEAAPAPDASPRRFALGSSPGEREAALSLCREHLGEACEASWYASETPREVVLGPFALDPREVTVDEFGAFIGERQTRAERGASHVVVGLGALQVPGLSWREPGWDPAGDEPVVHVAREEAEAFCAARGQRLPTEEEWEAFARGEAHRRFPWGDAWDPDRVRWRGSESVQKPAPVGSFPAAPAEVFDLAGNVWEWTATREGGQTVAKGGSWAEANPANLRAAARLLVDEDYTAEDLGFRCARETQTWLAAAAGGEPAGGRD